MQALVIRISRDVYVLDNTVNFMLNKRKSKKAAGSYQRSPKTPLLSREGARPLPYPPPVLNIFIRPPLSQNPGSAPGRGHACRPRKSPHTYNFTARMHACVSSIHELLGQPSLQLMRKNVQLMNKLTGVVCLIMTDACVI